MQLRWVNGSCLKKDNTALRTHHDIGWNNPNNLVLQQLWKSELGNSEWRNIEIEDIKPE